MKKREMYYLFSTLTIAFIFVGCNLSTDSSELSKRTIFPNADYDSVIVVQLADTLDLLMPIDKEINRKAKKQKLISKNQVRYLLNIINDNNSFQPCVVNGRRQGIIVLFSKVSEVVAFLAFCPDTGQVTIRGKSFVNENDYSFQCLNSQSYRVVCDMIKSLGFRIE